MLKEEELDKGGRPSENRLHDVTSLSKLSDLGIEKIQSHRWQKIANMPAHRPENNSANLPTHSQPEAAGMLNVSLYSFLDFLDH